MGWYTKKSGKEDFKNKSDFKLLNNKGFISKKYVKNIIRLPKLNKSDSQEEQERYCFSKLMTYVPWRKEKLQDIMEGYDTYSDCYHAHASTIGPLMEEYEKGDSDIKIAFQEISEKEPELDKNMENLQESLNEPEIESVFPREEDLENDDQEDDYHEDSLPSKSRVLKSIKDSQNYCSEVRSLNEEQKRIFWYVLDWVRQKKLEPNTPPLHLGIIGGAGTGKTKIINVLHQLFERELPKYGEKDIEKVTEKISFTGMAAANIDGRTWHSFLGVGHGKIESVKDIPGASKAESRNKLLPIEVIIEDEISLESSSMDTYMNNYLNNVLEKDEKHVYGGKSIVKVGDFMQLKPYGGSPIY